MTRALADQLLRTLPPSTPGLFNPWHDPCPCDAHPNGPSSKRARLARHLDCTPEFILVGEAPGYQGCRYTGVAFTSERLILEGAIPRIPITHDRLSTRHIPFSEPSATIVWRKLFEKGLQDRVILWNALQLHPHPIGQIWANRTPTQDELAIGRPALRILQSAFPSAAFIAVGKKALHALHSAHINAITDLRHPANGGATKFSLGLDGILHSTRNS